MYRFHVTIHALPPDAEKGLAMRLSGLDVRPLVVGQEAFAAPLDATFEEAGEALVRQPRLFFEPDGSFVWRGGEQLGWQVEGVLYDRAGRLLYVELKGSCPQPQFDQLLTALGWPQTALMFQLVREAVFLDETEFRSWAAINDE